MIADAGVENVGHVGVGDGGVLGRQIGQRVRGQLDLAVGGDALRGFDAAEQQRQHHRKQQGEFDRRKAATVGDQAAREWAMAAKRFMARPLKTMRKVRF